MSYIWQRWLAHEFRAAGLKVVEVQGWKDRGRPASTGDFDPDGPVTVHHTGSTTSAGVTHPTLNTLIVGRSDLPGPLCHWSVAYDGTVYVVAAGRANHAGRIGKSGVLGMPNGGDGNAHALGDEVDTNGTQGLPKAQRDAIALTNAVALKHKRRTSGWVHRHQDISSTGKWDIGNISTAALRSDTAAALKGLGRKMTDNHVQKGRTAVNAGVRQIRQGLAEFAQVPASRVAVKTMATGITAGLRLVVAAMKAGPKA